MATDTIRIPITWKPLLTQLKNAVTAEQGEQILQAAIASLAKPSPDEIAELTNVTVSTARQTAPPNASPAGLSPATDSPQRSACPIDDNFPPASWDTSRDRGKIPPPPFLTPAELQEYRARNSAASEMNSAIAATHHTDNRQEPQPESISTPEPVTERVRLILRNEGLASVVIGTQRYRVDKVLDLPCKEADALEAALHTQQQGYTTNPTRIERLP